MFAGKLAELLGIRKQPDLTIAPCQIWGEDLKIRMWERAVIKFRSICISAALLTSICAAYAGEISEAGVAAENLMNAGKFDEALRTLETARDAVWNQAPLTFRKTIFVAAEPAGFGIYDIRENNEFKSGEPLVIYAEPVGFSHRRDGQIFITDMALDFEIKDSSGTSLAKQENFASWTLRSRVPNKEFMGKLDYNFTGLQPGDYDVITTVRDKNSEKANSFSMRFKIAP